jgi:hypothetical protein
LQSHGNAFYLYHFVTVIHANGGNELGAEYVLVEAKYERCFATGGVADHEESYDITSFGSHLKRTGRSVVGHVCNVIFRGVKCRERERERELPSTKSNKKYTTHEKKVGKKAGHIFLLHGAACRIVLS